jgi:hypothetical protein
MPCAILFYGPKVFIINEWEEVVPLPREASAEFGRIYGFIPRPVVFEDS